jgi:SAM-dependent methyltransferase
MTSEYESLTRRLVSKLFSDSRQAGLARRLRRLTKPRRVGCRGTPHRLLPVGRDFGFSRGKPIDRFYIEDFLRRQGGASEYTPGAIHGRVLEVADDAYTRQFGLSVDSIDIVDASLENPRATIVADLTDGANLLSDAYDCVICTQTLLVIYDIRAAIKTIHRILKPGGTALITVPGISQIIRPDIDTWGDYWRFTSLSARRLFEEVFEAENVTVDAYGNVLTASAFLYGLAVEDLKRGELELHDPDYQVTICVKAVK